MDLKTLKLRFKVIPLSSNPVCWCTKTKQLYHCLVTFWLHYNYTLHIQCTVSILAATLGDPEQAGCMDLLYNYTIIKCSFFCGLWDIQKYDMYVILFLLCFKVLYKDTACLYLYECPCNTVYRNYAVSHSCGLCCWVKEESERFLWFYLALWHDVGKHAATVWVHVIL